MQALKDFITTNGDQIQMIINALIVVFVIIFGGKQVLVAIKTFGDDMPEAFKHLLKAAIIVIIGVLGWAGLSKLATYLVPTTLTEVGAAVAPHANDIITHAATVIPHALQTLV